VGERGKEVCPPLPTLWGIPLRRNSVVGRGTRGVDGGGAARREKK